MSIWYLQGSKIRTLPPILTFSLLRFNYDFQRGERFKVTLILIKWVDHNQHWMQPKEYKSFTNKVLFFHHFLNVVIFCCVFCNCALNVFKEKSKQNLWIDIKCSQVETPLADALTTVSLSHACDMLITSFLISSPSSKFTLIK